MKNYTRRSHLRRGAFTALEAILITAIVLFVGLFLAYFLGGEKSVTPQKSVTAHPAGAAGPNQEARSGGGGSDFQERESEGLVVVPRKHGKVEWGTPGSVVSHEAAVKSAVVPVVSLEKQQLLEDFKKALMNKDPLQAFSRDRISRLSAVDLQACLEQAAGLEPGPGAIKLLQAVIAEWVAMEPSNAAEYACTISSLRLRAAMLNSAMDVWGEKDIVAAVSFAESIESQNARRAVMGNLLNTWASKDPGAAFDWLQSSSETDGRYLYAASTNLFVQFTRLDPLMAVSKAWALSDQNRKNAAIRVIASELVQNDNIDVLMGVFSGMQAGADRTILANEIARQIAYYQPARAMEWINTSITDPAEKTTAMNSLIGTWANDQPEQAANWIMTELPDSSDRKYQLSRAMSSWIRDKPVEAINWLSEFPSSSLTDPSAQIVARELSRTAPDVAIQWAESITDVKTRNSTIQQVASQWLRVDSEKATAYVQASNFSEAEKTRILSGRDRNWRRGMGDRFRRER